MGTARDAAIEYFRCMREGDADSIERLFAPDAVLSVFNGTLRQGRREIRDFYENSGMQQGVRPHPQEALEDDKRCAVEIVVGLPDGSWARVVDIFTVNEDAQVSSLRVYQGLLLDGDIPGADSPE